MYRKRAFTLVELFVVISIIAVLVSILLPAVQRVRASARSSQSKNNLAQMGKAMKHYEGLGRGNLRHANWKQQILPYIDEQDKVFVDPADDNGPESYALTNKVAAMGAGDFKKIAIIESDDPTIVIDNTNCTGGEAIVTGNFVARHTGTVNALLYGGSVRTFEPRDIDMADTTKQPLVVWWLPEREHGLVCGTVVDNPNELPGPSDTDPDATLQPTGSEPPPASCISGKTVRITLEGSNVWLNISEVQVYDADGNNVAEAGTAVQSSTLGGASASRAIDGIVSGHANTGSIAHTNQETDPWWEVDLSSESDISRIVVWRRTDCCVERLAGAKVDVFDAVGAVVHTSTLGDYSEFSYESVDFCPVEIPGYDPETGFPELADLWITDYSPYAGSPAWPPFPPCASGANWSSGIPWFASNDFSQWPIECGFGRGLRADPGAGDGWTLMINRQSNYSYELLQESYLVQTIAGYDVRLKVTRQCDGDLRLELNWHDSAMTYAVWLGEPGNGGQPIGQLYDIGSSFWQTDYENRGYPGTVRNNPTITAIVPGSVTGDFPCEPGS